MPIALRLVAATALVAATGLTGPALAYAEACSTASGVTVVVDFRELGGGLQQVCDTGGGGQRASALFPDNGFPLTYVQRQPGFVCRVSGAPVEDPCVNTPPANAYWGLWWSDGDSGSWTYATTGVGSLTVPAGGSVAFSWNGSSTKSPPGAPPPAHEPAQEPTQEPEPTRDPTATPSAPPPTSDGSTAGGGGSSSTEPSPSGSESASPDSGDRSKREGGGDEANAERARRDRDEPKDERTPEPTSTPTDVAIVSEPPAAGEDPGLPVWVGPSAVAGLLGVAGMATYLRRRMS